MNETRDQNEQSVGPLEMRILGLLKERSDASVQELTDELNSQGSPVAYTTVLTVLSRLYAKNLAGRKKEGRRYRYFVSGAARNLGSSLIARVTQTLFSRQRIEPILTLIDQKGISQSDLEDIKLYVEQKISGAEKND